MNFSAAPASAAGLSDSYRTADAVVPAVHPAAAAEPGSEQSVVAEPAAPRAVRPVLEFPAVAWLEFSAIPSDPVQDAVTSQCDLCPTTRSCSAGAAPSASL